MGTVVVSAYVEIRGLQTFRHAALQVAGLITQILKFCVFMQVINYSKEVA
jgi:hypothetical protein